MSYYNHISNGDFISTIGDYKICSYTTQKVCSKSFSPVGEKRVLYQVLCKITPFPNKSIILWKCIKDGFTSISSAKKYIDDGSV